MADHEDIVEAADLIELARETRILVLRLDGVKGQNGLLSRIESAAELLEKIDAILLAAVEKARDVAKFGTQIEELPERLLSKADSLAFRSALSRVIAEVNGAEIEKMQQIELDHLDSELKFRANRLADDIFSRKIGPDLRNARALARLKQDREDYKTRAEIAEKALETANKALVDFKGLGESAETSILEQIERIRVSATQPNCWALFAVFAIGWGAALLAGAAWDVATTWITGQSIPYG